MTTNNWPRPPRNMDIFEGTKHEDKRSETRKAIDLEIQRRAQPKARDFSGLPMFDQEEQEARATLQLSLF